MGKTTSVNSSSIKTNLKSEVFAGVLLKIHVVKSESAVPEWKTCLLLKSRFFDQFLI